MRLPEKFPHWHLFQKLSSFLLLKSKHKAHLMSRHTSFGKSNKGTKKRNVLKRFERVDVLKKLGRWSSEESKKVTGLPKTPIMA
jgi:small basic protein (TIGR04137 family)